MNDYIIFKGENSHSKNVVVTELPEITVPDERVEFTDVPGRSGSLTQTEGMDVYNDITLTVQCYARQVTEPVIASIAGYFHGSGKLILPNRPGGYYEARVVNQIPISKILRGNPQRRFAVNFRCKPLFRLDTGEVEQLISSSGDFITNHSFVHSKPLIRIEGSGDITLMVGTQIVQLTDVDGGIILDCEYQEAYWNDELCNEKMSGNFPVLLAGNNAITWSGNVTSVKITPRWVTL